MAERTCSHDGEEWRPVVGHEGWYEVSNHGRVRRVVSGYGTRVGYVLKPLSHPRGYRWVCLSLGPGIVRRKFLIHRLVAAAFIGPCPPDHEVNHKDGDKANNHAPNLEWVTRSANLKHAHATGLANPARGPRNGNGRLTDEQVAEIRALQDSENATETAKRYGIDSSTVRHIRLGKRRRPR